METNTNRGNIILVLKESVRLGKEVNFIYHNMFEKHKDVLFIKKLDTTIKEKINLFENLSEQSYTFQRILETAKSALKKLQEDEGYNYHSAELILKFNQLEDCFKKKLKPIGVRIIEQSEKPKQEIKKSNHIEQEEEMESFIDEEGNKIFLEKVVPLTKGARYVKEKMTGSIFEKKLKQQKEISQAIKETNFSE